MEILILWIFFGIICAVAASGKGRSGLGWFILGILFGPFALLLVLVASKKQKTVKADN